MKEQRLIRRAFICVYLLHFDSIRKNKNHCFETSVIRDCWKNPKTVRKITLH